MHTTSDPNLDLNSILANAAFTFDGWAAQHQREIDRLTLNQQAEDAALVAAGGQPFQRYARDIADQTALRDRNKLRASEARSGRLLAGHVEHADTEFMQRFGNLLAQAHQAARVSGDQQVTI